MNTEETRTELLSEAERRIISVVQHRAHMGIKEIAPLCSVPEYTVRRMLASLRRRQILLTRCHFVDHYRIGMVGGSIYLALHEPNPKKEAEFVALLRQSIQVTYVARMSGEFDYLVAFMAESFKQLQEIFARLLAQHGDLFKRRELSLTTRFSAFSREHLAPDLPEHPAFHVESSVPAVEIDALDRLILWAVSENEYQTNREVARRLNLHHTLIERRLKRLRELGVVRGMFYRFNSAAMGFHLYRILVTVRDYSDPAFVAIREFAASHPQILRSTETMGPAEFQFDIEVGDPGEVSQFVDVLRRHYGASTGAISILKIEEHCHYRSFPFPAPALEENSAKKFG